MTVVSMTGFGSASRTWSDPRGSAGEVRVDVEIRSVNARFLELKVRQPFGPASEKTLRARAEKRLGRGRVELGVFVRRPRTEAGGDDDGLGRYGLDDARVEAAIAAAARVESLAARQNVEVRSYTSLELLRFLTTTQRSSSDAQAEAPPFLGELVDAALKELVAFRRTEGEALGRALEELTSTLAGQVQSLAALLPGELQRLQTRWMERVAELLGDAGSPDPARVAQEVALLVARGDIEEELARIDSHLSQMRSTLAAKPSKGQGKTLDFVTQELLREVTTIGSKITSHDGSRIVIEAKSTIERIREQVANVE